MRPWASAYLSGCRHTRRELLHSFTPTLETNRATAYPYPATSLRSRTYIAAIFRVQRGVEALAAAAGLGSYRYSHCTSKLVHALCPSPALCSPASTLRPTTRLQSVRGRSPSPFPSRAIALSSPLLRAQGLSNPHLFCRVAELCDSLQALPRLLIVIRQHNTQPPRSPHPRPPPYPPPIILSTLRKRSRQPACLRRVHALAGECRHAAAGYGKRRSATCE